jgi:uncharacterized membrane protein
MTRRALKEQAKEALRENFGTKMLLLLIPILLGIFSGVDRINTIFGGHSSIQKTHGVVSSLPTGLVAFIAVMVLIGLIIGLAVGLFITVITFGAIFNYIKIFRGERANPRFSNIFIPFKDGSLWKIVLLNLLKGILIFVMAIIPIIGWVFLVYFMLGWSQSTYVLFDQLEKGEYRGTWGVLNESSELMKGRRWNYFVFQLSFFWWFVLNIITLQIVGFWTMPYITMANIAYYDNLLNEQSVELVDGL